jgi:hypothetical protein
MQVRLFLASLVILAAMAPTALAESTDCTTPVVIIPDGRITQSSFPQNTTYWYGIYAQAGHSYSVEFEPPADNFLNASRPQFNSIGIFAPNDFLQACRGNSSVTVTQNSGISPVILKNPNGAGRRVSFTAQSAGLHLVFTAKVAGTGNYSFRAVDTTLFNPRWNTNSGNDTQWGVFNLSEMTVTGTLTVFDGSGRILSAVQITIPPNGRINRFTGTSDLNLPRNIAGSATFSHNGPPNAVLADAFLASSTGLAPVPLKFEALASR